MRAVFNSTAPLAKGVDVGDFSLSLAPHIEIVSSAGASDVTVKDRLVSRAANATYDQLYVVVPAVPSGEAVTITNLTPAVATIDPNGEAVRVSDGTSILELTSGRGPAFLRRRFSSGVRRVVGSAVDTLYPQTGAPGSLRKHLWDQILAAIAGKTPGPATQNLFTSHTIGASPSATLNTNLWLPLDFSHSSFQKTFEYNGAPLTTKQAQCHLISPRHAIASQHVSEHSFEDVVFRRSDGSFQTVSSIGWRKFGNDSVVHYFDEPVTGINPVKFVPPSYHDKLPDFWMDSNSTGYPTFTLRPYYPIPAVALMIREGSGSSDAPMATEERRLRFQLIEAVHGETWGIFRRQMYQSNYPFQPHYSNLQPWTAGAREGDSSSMTYLVINGELCAFGLQWSYNSGPCMPECLDTLTLEMNSLAASFGDSTVYTPLTADISMFPSY